MSELWRAAGGQGPGRALPSLLAAHRPGPGGWRNGFRAHGGTPSEYANSSQWPASLEGTRYGYVGDYELLEEIATAGWALSTGRDRPA